MSLPNRHTKDSPLLGQTRGKITTRSDRLQVSRDGTTMIDVDAFLRAHTLQNKHMNENDFRAMQDLAIAANPHAGGIVAQPLRRSRLAERLKQMDLDETPIKPSLIERTPRESSRLLSYHEEGATAQSVRRQGDATATPPHQKQTPSSSTPPSSARLMSSTNRSSTPDSPCTQTFDKAYVDKHPEETFHHRGKGRWAQGLPPPGSNVRTAVRGARYEEWKARIS